MAHYPGKKKAKRKIAKLLEGFAITILLLKMSLAAITTHVATMFIFQWLSLEIFAESDFQCNRLQRIVFRTTASFLWVLFQVQWLFREKGRAVVCSSSSNNCSNNSNSNKNSSNNNNSSRTLVSRRATAFQKLLLPLLLLFQVTWLSHDIVDDDIEDGHGGGTRFHVRARWAKIYYCSRFFNC